eukprot:CAMPEP_0183360794 /NCGR_PEP_ID=MMETSP0164_2-20130417/56078_1 /TAXON_ID=221442 /ORGANISM="Coccolithus pelagicus ssp braarudi, Strain PLY182g" /LENGTH=30 /DNA_ID= /DNA_START= /DNA_END= /DNA_ORIENTATION=
MTCLLDSQMGHITWRRRQVPSGRYPQAGTL